jgi:hypothetical protein
METHTRELKEVSEAVKTAYHEAAEKNRAYL